MEGTLRVTLKVTPGDTEGDTEGTFRVTLRVPPGATVAVLSLTCAGGGGSATVSP